MANFTPLNNYSLFILDRLITKYNLKQPFLDVACGNGYVSKHLAKKGWSGVALDYSSKAIAIAKESLKDYKRIEVVREPFSKASGKYNTILMFDFLEHVEDDVSALKKAHSLLADNGFIVIAGPSNMREWRWDDDFYGHFRRYSDANLKSKLSKTGFKHIISYDYTYPFFWALRRIYTFLINKQKTLAKNQRTEESSYSYAWGIPIIGKLLNKTELLWFPVYIFQYIFFKGQVLKGSSMIVLAIKK